MELKVINLNETIQSKHSKGNEYDYSVPVVLTIHISMYIKLYYINNPGNCKVGTVMRLQDCMASYEDVTVKRLKELFTKGSRKFGFKATFNNYASVQKVAKYFPVLYVTKVPMVESTGHQYHAMFWTNRTDGPSFTLYRDRIAREQVQVLLDATDNAPQGTTSLVRDLPARKVLTEAQMDKIKAYKSKYHLVKYVDKLINGETP